MAMPLGLVFPPGLFVTAASAVGLAAYVSAGLSEARGKHLAYSKFAGAVEAGKTNLQVPSRIAMVSVYTPAFLAGAASFVGFPDEHLSLRFLLLISAIAIHFFKRILESVLVHRYSGVMPLSSMITIGTSYLVSASAMIYIQHTTQGLLEPALDLMYPGLALFVIGTLGNFYHHLLLSKLRSGGHKEYAVPRGGWFDLVVCPHYLFEILSFLGMACIAQTLYALSVALGTCCYLAGRSVSTRNWYLSKFEDFPRHRKALIPYIF